MMWIKPGPVSYTHLDVYKRQIQALNAIPENWRNYRTAYARARALENYAIIGDHDEGTLKSGLFMKLLIPLCC